MKKLEISDPQQLKNYIIPRGGVKEYPILAETDDKIDANGVITYRNDQPFIRWDALTILINDSLIPQNENQKSPINVVADRIYDEGNGTFRLDPLQFATITALNSTQELRHVYDFSTDPNTCILPIQFNQVRDEFVTEQLGYKPELDVFPKGYIKAVYGKPLSSIKYKGKPLTNSRKLEGKDINHRIGSIFLNINMIDYIASKNSEVNKACPNHNFVLVDDKESNSLYIIDLPVDTEELPTSSQLHEFIPFSNKNILRNFSYTSNVPSALSSTIAIQAQNPRSIQDIDGVTFAAFNRSIKNRLFSVDATSTWKKTQEEIEEEANSLQTKLRILDQELYNYRFNFFRDLSNEANDRDLQGGNIQGILKEYQQLSTYISVASGLGSSFTSVIPLEFNATLDGISGIVIGNMFKIQKDRLPKAYKQSDIGFIVFNEEQKITAGGDWTTDISGKMVLLDSKKSLQKIPISDTILTEEFTRATQFGLFPSEYGDTE